MSDSIHITPTASTAVQHSKASSMGAGNNNDVGDEPSEFTTMFNKYAESEPATSEQNLNDDEADPLSASLPQDALEAGNILPVDEKIAMWQALMLLQPTETIISNPAQIQATSLLEQQQKPMLRSSLLDNAIANSMSTKMQAPSLLDKQPQPAVNTSMLNQYYSQNMDFQNKEAANSITAGAAINNINTQLAAAHFIPEKNEALLLNMNELLMPVQGANSTVTQGLAAVGLGTATQAAATQTQMSPLNLGQNAWESNLGSRLQMLVGQNVQSAEIRLDPPELGALNIKIKITNDVASVNITSPHAHVREALEAAVPKLREMFEGNGLSLGDVNVRQESFSQQQNSTGEDTAALGSTTDSEFRDEPVTVTRKIVSDSLLDIYA